MLKRKWVSDQTWSWILFRKLSGLFDEIALESGKSSVESEEMEKKNQENFQKILDDEAYYGTGWEEKTLRQLVEKEKNDRLKQDQDKQGNQMPPAEIPGSDCFDSKGTLYTFLSVKTAKIVWIRSQAGISIQAPILRLGIYF